MSAESWYPCPGTIGVHVFPRSSEARTAHRADLLPMCAVPTRSEPALADVVEEPA